MTDTTTGAMARADIMRFVKANIRDYALLLSLLAIMVFFQFTTNGTLFKPVNMTNLILQNSYIVIMALGMLLVIVAGHIDLSVGSVAGFIGAMAGLLGEAKVNIATFNLGREAAGGADDERRDQPWPATVPTHERGERGRHQRRAERDAAARRRLLEALAHRLALRPLRVGVGVLRQQQPRLHEGSR